MKYINAVVAATVALLASLVSAESFELFNGSIATNEMTIVTNVEGDHITIVNSTLEVTNDFVTTDIGKTGNARRTQNYVGITNSTLTSLSGIININCQSASGNTTRVDVVNSVFNATNSTPGMLSLGVWNPNATWGERVFFHAADSTFNLSAFRGYGAFEALFFASLAQFRDRFPLMLTFVNQINKRSENAHNNKAHMETIGTFDFGGNHYFLMGIRTDAADQYKGIR